MAAVQRGGDAEKEGRGEVGRQRRAREKGEGREGYGDYGDKAHESGPVCLLVHVAAKCKILLAISDYLAFTGMEWEVLGSFNEKQCDFTYI